MTLGQRLRDARKRSGYTQKKLAELIGAKHNSVSNWENGLNMPDPTTIELICATLNVTPNFLLMRDDTVVHSAEGFSANEVLIINKYRSLEYGAKGAVDALLNYYSELTTAKVFELPARKNILQNIENTNLIVDSENLTRFETLCGLISTQSVAAGTGTYLDKDAFDDIVVQKNDLTRRAAFFVPVSGNSMEPRFHNGDVLIIEKTAVLQGEIGIFTLDGSGFVKVRGKNELISLNPDYAPIPMNDDVVCNGKVIGVLEPDWLIN